MSIKIHIKIFLLVLLFYVTKQVELYAMFMLFAFFHEIGHLLSGLLVGLKPKSLHIMPMGLSITFQSNMIPKTKDGKKRFYLQSIMIALAGPMTNFLIIIACMCYKTDLLFPVYEEILYANLLICLLNSLPIYPLDGGRIMKAIMKMKTGEKQASYMQYMVSNATMIVLTMLASVAIYYYQNIAILLIIVYLWGLVCIENRRYHLKKRIHKIIENS